MRNVTLNVLIREILQANLNQPMKAEQVYAKIKQMEEKGLIEKDKWKMDTLTRLLREMSSSKSKHKLLDGDARKGYTLGFSKRQKTLESLGGFKIEKLQESM